MALTGEREISPEGWVREQTEKILSSGTTDGVQVLDRPIVLVTVRGAKSGKLRYTPVMRALEGGTPHTVSQIAEAAGITQPAATQTVALMNPDIRSEVMLGRISRKMIRALPSPLTIAAATKSFSRSEST